MFNDVDAQLLKTAAIGVIPTDTVYGVVARAADPEAVRRLYALKGRQHKPGTLIAASIDQLVALGIKRRYLTAVEQFWPGPISVIVPSGPELDYLHLGKLTLAVRLPDNQELRNLLLLTGPLLTSSANLSGQPPATNASQAQAYFNDDVDFCVDGGDLSNQRPSTIIRVVDDAIEIIRQGAAKVDSSD